MAHTVSVKLAGKIGRIRLEETNLQSKVSDFRMTVTSKIGKQELPENFNLVYCGRLLNDESTLEESGVKPGSTIHVLKRKVAEEEPKIDPMDETDIRQLMTALHAALLNPSHRQAVHKILTSTETIDNIIAATPGMSADHIAVSMLRDPQLLVQVADPENVRSIVREHPAIGHAVMNIAASVNEEAAHSSRTGSGLGQEGSFGLFPDFVGDEDMDTSEAGASSNASGGSRARSGITAAQLSAALNVAGVGGLTGSSATGSPQTSFLRPFQSSSTSPRGPPPPGASGTTPQSQPGSSSGAITADVFQQALARAMQAAQPGTSNNANSLPANSNTEQDFTAQLKQLSDMGITDEEVSLRALRATNGNVDAALHLIFEEKHMS